MMSPRTIGDWKGIISTGLALLRNEPPLRCAWKCLLPNRYAPFRRMNGE